MIERVINTLLMNSSLTQQFHVSTFYTFSYLYKSGSIIKLDFFDHPTQFVPFGNINLEATKIKETYSSLMGLEENAITIALRRLLYLRNKQSLEDKFLYLMIILEGLFPKIQDELKFRLSICIGALLKSKNDCDQLRIMYDLRSSIAHGSEVSKKQLKKLGGDLDTARLLLDEIARKSILKCIDFIEDGRLLVDLEDYLLKTLYN